MAQFHLLVIFVMAGLAPAINIFRLCEQSAPCMPGMGPGMTAERAAPSPLNDRILAWP